MTQTLEEKRAYSREYMRRRREDPEIRERERARGREYDKRRPDEVKERRRQKDRERGARLRRENDPKYREQQRRAYRKSYRKHAEDRRAKRRAYGQKPEVKARAAAYAREWRKKNPGLRRGRTKPTREFALVLLRDPCSYCGRPANEIDHIDPVALGGDREWENTTAACSRCNRSKNDSPLLAWLTRRAA